MEENNFKDSQIYYIQINPFSNRTIQTVGELTSSI